VELEVIGRRRTTGVDDISAWVRVEPPLVAHVIVSKDLDHLHLRDRSGSRRGRAH